MKDTSEAERVFNELAKNGRIVMPLERTFWAARFGMLVDRFGIRGRSTAANPMGRQEALMPDPLRCLRCGADEVMPRSARRRARRRRRAPASRSRYSVGRMPCSSSARTGSISRPGCAVPAGIAGSTWMRPARCTRPICRPTPTRPSPRWRSWSARVRRSPSRRSGWLGSRRSSPSWSSCSSEIGRRAAAFRT